MPGFADERIVISGDRDASFATGFSLTGVSTSANGGGISIENLSTLTFEGTSSFTNNSSTNAGGLGGAIFINNNNGGAGPNDNQVNFNGAATFTGNDANGGGAGLYSEGIVIFDDTATFSDNTTTGGSGAAIGANELSDITFNGAATFTGNGVGTTTTGGAISNSGNMVFNDTATFDGNHATTNGAAINNGGTMIFRNGLSLTNNVGGSNSGAVSNGGDFFAYGGDIIVTGNTANKGSGLFLGLGSRTFLGADENGVASPVENITFSNNTANDVNAAALAVQDGVDTVEMRATNITFDGNVSATKYGGAIFNASELKILGTNNTFSNNELHDSTGGKTGGGAIHNRGVLKNGKTADLTIGTETSTNLFENNTSESFGGAIAARAVDGAGQDSSVTINGATTFNSNHADMNGGAIWNQVAQKDGTTGEALVTVNGASTFTSNTAGDLGGAIFNNGETVFNGATTFTDNQAGGLGGAIYNTGVTTINGSGTFSGNKSNYVDSTNFTLNDIYNTNTVNLNATSGQNISFASGIDGVNGTLNINATDGYTGAVVFNANVSGNSVNVARGTLTNNAVLDGALAINGGTVENQNGASEITGSVTIADGASLSTKADKFATDNAATVSNAGTLTLKGGISSNPVELSKDITGDGSLVIDGVVSNNGGEIYNAVTINNNKSFTTDADLLKNTVANAGSNGKLTLIGGTLEHNVTGGGKLYIAGDVVNTANISNTVTINSGNSLTTAAGLLGNTVANNSGSLVLTDGTLEHNVTGDGSLVVDGAVINTGNIDNTVTINSGTGKSLETNASLLNNTITNAGLLTLTGGTLAHNVSGTGNLNVTGEVNSSASYLGMDVNNTGTLNLTGGTLAHNVAGTGNLNVTGEVDSSASYLGMDVNNTGTLNLTGGTLAHNVAGTGNLNVTGGVDSNASYLGMDVNNTGTLNLTGGTLAHNVSGTGNLNVTGAVDSSASYLGMDVNNTGTLNLTGGTLAHNVAGTGILNVTGEVDSSASYLGMNVNNTGTLTLTSGTLEHNVTGGGSLVVDGIVSNNGGEIYNAVTINNNKSFTTNADLLKNTVENSGSNGKLTLTGGTLEHNVTGGGKLYIAGDVVNTANISNTVTINSGKSLTTAAGLLGNTVANSGSLTLTSGTLGKSVTGNGIIYVTGNVSSNANFLGNNVNNSGTLTLTSGTLSKDVSGNGGLVINGAITNNGGNIGNAVTINSGKSLTTSASLLGNNVSNSGTLTLTAGSLTHDVSGSGTVNVSGVVSNSGNLNNLVNIQSSGELTTLADKLKKTVTNNGDLILTGNALSQNVNGTGDLFITGAVSNTGTIANAVTIRDTGSFTTNAGKLQNTVANAGILTLNGGTLAHAVSGQGDVNVTGNVVNNSSIAAHSIDIQNGGALTSNANRLSGALNNDGTLTLTGNGALSQDITGNGTLNIAEGGTLDVGLRNIEQGTINLNGTMVAELDDSVAGPRFTATNFNGAGTLRLTMREAGTYNIFGDDMFDTRLIEFDPAGIDVNSPVYNLVWGADGTITAQQKTAEEISLDNHVSEDAGLMVSNLMNSTDAKLNDLALVAQNRLANDDKVAVERASLALAPESMPIVQAVGTTMQNTLSTLTANRLSMPLKRDNYGDLHRDAMWVQGLYNRTKQNDGFDGYTRGVAVGFDGMVKNTWTFGAGYVYAQSDIVGTERDIDIDSLAVMLYGQYKAAAWYVNAFIDYNMSNYTENGFVFNAPVNAEYKVNGFGGQISTGYNFNGGFAPELGLRYTHLSVDEYKNSLGVSVITDDKNFVTASLGARYGYGFEVRKNLILRPELSYAVKYDVVADDMSATIMIPGVDSYSVYNDGLSRVATELNAGLGVRYRGVDVSVGYEIEAREAYTSQTGRARFRIEF